MYPGYLAVLAMDISTAKQTEAELRKAEVRYRNIFDYASMGVYRSTPDGCYQFVNNVMARMYGYDSPQEMIALIGNDIASRIYVDPRKRDELNRRLDNASIVNGFEAEHRRKDGSTMLVRIHAHATWSDSGVPQYYLGFVKDITASAQTNRRLQESERQFRSLAENMYDVIWTLDNEHRFTYINPSIRSLRGLEPEEAMIEGYLDSFTPESRTIIRHAMARQSGAEANGWMDSAFYLQVQQYHREGRLAWVELLMQALRDVQGHRIGYLGISRDITARKRAEEELQHASTHDKLTGLYNRAHFQEELSRMCREGRFPFSIILTDVNDLKHANDSRGHSTGDELLRRAAQVLRSSSRSDALVARYGGDEFTILLPDASAVAARAAVLLLKAETLLHNSTHVGPAFSMAIGVATATAPINPDELIRIVDARMYEDKRTRKA
jgi:diguanylate cyclase (GGDEF)-like protein/PAS domain S-box-containing protein